MSAFPFLTCFLVHTWNSSYAAQCCSHDLHGQHQWDWQEHPMWVGLGWVCLCHSCHLLLANAFTCLGHFIPQVHFHWHLHFWVIDKNIGERILHDRIHLPSRSMELVGFQRYCYGVSSTPLYISGQQYVIEFFKKLSDCSLFSLKLYQWENAEVY